jgi:hypothetical protein
MELIIDERMVTTLVATIILLIYLGVDAGSFGWKWKELTDGGVVGKFGLLFVAFAIYIIVVTLEWFYPEYAISTWTTGSYEWDVINDTLEMFDLLGLYSTEAVEDIDELMDAQDEFEEVGGGIEDIVDDGEINQSNEDEEVAEEDVSEETGEDNVETMINIEPFAQANKDTFIAYVKSIYGPLYGKMASMLYNTEAIQALRSQADREAAIENIINKHISGNKRGFKRILKGILKKRRNPLA